VVLVGAAASMLNGCEGARPGFNSGDITGAGWGGDFRVPDHNGVVRTLGDFRGKVVLLFFGFTQCPDVCPTALLRMQGVMRLLGQDAERVQVLFMTIDPERDLPVVLKEYVTQFDKRFLGLAASVQETAEVARRFNAFYRKVEGKTPTSYTMDHSTFTYGFDVKGRLRILIPHNLEEDKLTEDVRKLLSA
jgi:protein SCO1